MTLSSGASSRLGLGRCTAAEFGRRSQLVPPTGITEALRQGLPELALGEAGTAGGRTFAGRQSDQPGPAGGFL